ncbi:MAG: hypothetical protein IIU00_05230 [Clostridia bacterium]|nr:hypothetical protein [Clostridia bacterium]
MFFTKRMISRFTCCTAALLLCVSMTACTLPVKVIGRVPDPQDTVASFFDSVCRGDYEAADLCLNGCSIAMKQQPTDVFSAALLEYLKESYAWEPVELPETSLTEAHQTVMFRHLDPALLSDDLRAAASKLGKQYLRTRDPAHTQMTDGVCSLTEEGAQAVAAEALDSLMTAPDAYYASDIYDITLTLEGSKWKIQMTDELFDAIVGRYNPVDEKR